MKYKQQQHLQLKINRMIPLVEHVDAQNGLGRKPEKTLEGMLKGKRVIEIYVMLKSLDLLKKI